MSPERSTPGPEALLAHGRFVRALARHLVHDEQLADDIVQESFVTALDSGPRRPDSLRSWLACVARNVALKLGRSQRHRIARERRVARKEALPSVEMLAERRELLRVLIDAILALPEPSQTVILMRFYEDRPSREIARELGEPLATVKSRLQRSVRELRRLLDDRVQGGRSTWLPGLVALAGLRSPLPAAVASSPWTASTVGSLGTRIVIVALLLGVGLTVWSVVESPVDRSAPEITRQRDTRVGRAPSGAAEPTLPDRRRTESPGREPLEPTVAGESYAQATGELSSVQAPTGDQGTPGRYVLHLFRGSRTPVILRLDTASGEVRVAETALWSPYIRAVRNDGDTVGRFSLSMPDGPGFPALHLLDTATGAVYLQGGGAWALLEGPK